MQIPSETLPLSLFSILALFFGHRRGECCENIYILVVLCRTFVHAELSD